MRLSLSALGTTLVIGILGQSAPATAQEGTRLFGGFSAGLTFVDTRRDNLLDGPGYHLTGFVGRRFTPHVAGLAEVSLTTLNHQKVFFGYAQGSCAYPGCATFPDLRSITGLTIAPGLQFYHATHDQKLAFTLAPGAVWFVSRPSGAHPVSPMVGGRLEYGWLLGGGPRFGISLGAQWWGSNGVLPRWTVPLGVAVEFH